MVKKRYRYFIVKEFTKSFKRQNSRLIVNLADSSITFGKIEELSKTRPVEGLEKLIW